MFHTTEIDADRVGIFDRHVSNVARPKMNAAAPPETTTPCFDQHRHVVGISASQIENAIFADEGLHLAKFVELNELEWQGRKR